MTTITDTSSPTSWPLSGRLLDVVSRRDFDGLEHCLSDSARFRALVPPGPFELCGPQAIGDRFRTWFGGEDAFEVLEASASEIGSKQYLRWRIQMTTDREARVCEQHLYITGTDAVETIELLCSGFHACAGVTR